MGEIENQERMDHEEACTQLFMPTIEDFQVLLLIAFAFSFFPE